MSIVDSNTQCISCQECNFKQQTYPMQKSHLPGFHLDHIAIGTTGPFPISYNGNRYLITVMNLLTSHPETYPVLDKSAEIVAKALSVKLNPTHSCPITVLSDNVTDYKNKTVDEVCKNLRIERIFTSPYHPQSNGKLEGWHRKPHEFMRKLIQDCEAIWTKLMSNILMANRVIPNESGTSPFSMMYD